MDLMFYAVPSLIMAVTLFLAVKVIRRALELRRVWNSGLTAEARCLRTYTTTSGGSGDSSVRTTLHHVYEFTARDGRSIRFEEEDGPGTTVEGDIVVVHYAEGETVKATAQAPGHVKNAASTVALLVFLSVVVAFCAGFMVTYTEAFAGSESSDSQVNEPPSIDDQPFDGSVYDELP
ncbi:hypothetical protein [Streptomyces sp. NBC_00878]|uniref:hypothetical protein n=1 Tax=Streptomyces sp. NBC_00878 TaxID=2975854 RepID=UPI0022546CA6|nr:hypothetical protein [Streptomyces sp. NBC_00878]MCX4908434.1 hypothetical protein [Streptomyces sp. NBC_00878]